MRIGLFGGTFDPPHLGHFILAAEAFHQLKLDQLLFILTADPPHKKENHISPVADRLAMLEAALAARPAYQLSRIEVDRPGPHYAADTVRLLQEQNPGAALIYLMGGDSLRDLPNWHEPADLVAACAEIGVMRRLSDEIDLDALEVKLPGLSEKVHYVDAPLLEIASREIRQRIAGGEPYKEYLPREVTRVIEERGLYRS